MALAWASNQSRAVHCSWPVWRPDAAVSGNQLLSDLDLNGVLSMLREIAPKDEIEAMLMSQMITVHTLISTQARRLRSAETVP
jgi:hypothetical protein